MDIETVAAGLIVVKDLFGRDLLEMLEGPPPPRAWSPPRRPPSRAELRHKEMMEKLDNICRAIDD